MKMIMRLTCCFMSIALIVGPPVTSARADGSLFRPTADDARATGVPEPWELRRRLVSVNEQVLQPYCDPPGSGVTEDLTLNLFPDITLTAVAERIGRTTRAAGIRWVGGVRDVPDSSITLTALRLCDGVPGFSLSGSARINGEEYTIEPRSGGRVAITEIDTLALG